MAGSVDHGADVPAPCIRHHDAGEILVRPSHEDDVPAVAGPAGKCLERDVLAGERSRRAAIHVLDPETGERFEHDLPPIGADDGVFRDRGREAFGRDRNDRVGSIRYTAGIVHAERYDGPARTVGIHAPQLAARPEHDAAPVGRPVHVRIHAVDRPGFLHVHVEIAVNHAFPAAGDVLHPELRLVLIAPDESDGLALGRRRGANGAPISAHGFLRFARFEVVTVDLENARIRILRVFEDRAAGVVAREIDRLAIGREDRFAQFLLVLFAGSRDELHAPAAGNVIQPHLARAERAARREMLLRDDESPVRAPARLVEQAELLLGQRDLVAAVRIHQPDVVAAAPVGSEGDAFTVGAEARVHFPRQSFGNSRRRAPADGHGVDVAQQRKGDRPSVGRYVHVHPRAFVGTDGNLPHIRAARNVHVPLGIVFRRNFAIGTLHRLPAVVCRQVVAVEVGCEDLVLRHLGFLHWRVLLFVLRVRAGRGEHHCDDGGDRKCCGFHG